MPHPSDYTSIRRILRSDPVWAAYALLDLEPGFVDHAEWHSDFDTSSVLIYRGFNTPVLITVGSADKVQALLSGISLPSPLYFHIPNEILPVLAEREEIAAVYPMWRMCFDPSRAVNTGRPIDRHADRFPGPQRLSDDDLPSLLRLFEDGNDSGEAPGFFLTRMLKDGVYFGVFDGAELIAVAGTHTILPSEGLAAVGNVYTRRDRRGRGHGRAVTSAVAQVLLKMGIPNILLNVEQRNTAALRVYQGIGFMRHCEYVEGLTVAEASPTVTTADASVILEQKGNAEDG